MRRKYRCWLPCVELCASVPTLGTCLLKCLIPWCQPLPLVAPGGHLPLYGTLTWQELHQQCLAKGHSAKEGRRMNYWSQKVQTPCPKTFLPTAVPFFPSRPWSMPNPPCPTPSPNIAHCFSLGLISLHCLETLLCILGQELLQSTVSTENTVIIEGLLIICHPHRLVTFSETRTQSRNVCVCPAIPFLVICLPLHNSNILY